ncbi:protein of unknown function [Petrocella atlantisensis]|uniref:Uncharacterized protein n=1 Tax=Petrocella atlantisensis TaxID=2173034 RepID=A0A3P7PIT6_9FIRM|nr:protein of unknown function [Petrocella atlantisensis]
MNLVKLSFDPVTIFITLTLDLRWDFKNNE